MNGGERFLITGGSGFLGAWIAKQLLREGAEAWILDASRTDHILEQVLSAAELQKIPRLVGDVTDLGAVESALQSAQATCVIHLAAVQLPTCRVNPIMGARTNVLGTLNVFEAVRTHKGQVRSIVYASSAAVAGPPEDYREPISDDTPHRPRTHYGVFKIANEASARVYWTDCGIPSIGLRPLVVYGVGREVGLTSTATKAIKAAVLGREYTLAFSGTTSFSYAEDVAACFVACARARLEGACALNIRGDIVTVAEFVKAIDAAVPGAASRIRVSGRPIPVAWDFQQSGLEALVGRVPFTPVPEGIRRTAERFRELHARGELPVGDLEE